MATQSRTETVDDRQAFDVAGHRLTLIVEGAARLDALLALITSAERDLRLLYYTFAADGSGARVRDAAIAAANRGVAVSLLVDGFGSESTADAFFVPLVDAGASFCRFVPRYGRRYLLRNHQKMAIADAGRAIVGGFNIEDAYFSDGPDGWRDLGLLVEGPAAGHLVGYYDAVMAWANDPKAKMKVLTRLIGSASQPDGALRWLFGGPTKRLSPWAHALKRDVQRGRSLDIVAAYFTPNPGALRRFGRLARRGRARIVTASKSDNDTTIAAARHTYARLLRNHARLFEYQPQKLHAKLFVVDHATYIGSANCDMRSLFLNLEVMLRIDDATFAAAARRHVDSEIVDCREALPELLRAKAGPWTRLRWSIAYFVVAVVDYTITRRLNFKPGSGDIVT